MPEVQSRATNRVFNIDVLFVTTPHQGGIFVLPVWHLNIGCNKCNNVVNDFTFEEECDFLKGASSRQRMSPVFIILILVEVDDKEALSDQVQE